MTIIKSLFFRLFFLRCCALRSLRKLRVLFCLNLSDWEIVIFDTVSETLPLNLFNTRIPFIIWCNKCLLNWCVILWEVSRVLKINSSIELWWVHKLVDKNLQLVTILCAINHWVSVTHISRCRFTICSLIYHWLSNRRINLRYFFLEVIDFHLSQVTCLHVLWNERMVLQLLHRYSICFIGL